ncbi:ribosome biogenesis GTPase A [Oikeobacillus pervagus]|uniref:Ribosome biogenesis GTPase A n=1 Tax=Oikeobacillus pervagus TaxID=1325931 RepID=A0AAJ1T3K1_9BACI|nr:SE1561 family protein [Oikeobacillus pervagus]MDQ0216582.1 ribosome biogenesis GTPase A [Oikeobacillus pervagus]
MGKAIEDKDLQLTYLKERINMFLQVLDTIDPESTDLEDVDRLINMIEDIELKCQQFKKMNDAKLPL